MWQLRAAKVSSKLSLEDVRRAAPCQISPVLWPAVATSNISFSIPPTSTTFMPASSNCFLPVFSPTNFSGSLTPTYTVLMALPNRSILSTHGKFPLNLLKHGSTVVYSTVCSGRISASDSSGIPCASASFIKQHCSAWVLPSHSSV